jgi:hypothetical protein
MKVPIGGAVRIAAITTAYEKALLAWSNLSPKIQRSAEGVDLRRRLDIAGKRLEMLEHMVASETTPIVRPIPSALHWQHRMHDRL